MDMKPLLTFPREKKIHRFLWIGKYFFEDGFPFGRLYKFLILNVMYNIELVKLSRYFCSNM